MPKLRVRTWRLLLQLFIAVLFVFIVYRWISLERLQRFAPVAPEVSPSPTPELTPTPTRPPDIKGKFDTAKLFNGITIHSGVETPPGSDASTERVDADSYVLDLKLLARLPAPNKTIEELAKVNPQLPNVLPGLASMIGPESVSPLYAELYATKVHLLRENLVRLETLLSRHNFYDCQTVLRLQHPQTHRKALLLQADMDVDADGSDPDRMPIGPAVTTNFKPFTSYKWNKKTNSANPYLSGWEERLKKYEEEAALKTTAAERKKDLRAWIAQLQQEISTMKKFSFLIGAADPYIVVPGSFAHSHDGPKVGDYALVVFGDKIYPALVGDVGPNDKVGEASFRIAKEVNNQATPYSRPVSDLKVTYLIFPGSADTPWGPPDYDKIQARCQKLADEIGGTTTPLHRWENIIPTPTPTATPSPTPSPASSASSTPSATSSGSASPASTFAFPIATPSP